GIVRQLLRLGPGDGFGRLHDQDRIGTTVRKIAREFDLLVAFKSRAVAYKDAEGRLPSLLSLPRTWRGKWEQIHLSEVWSIPDRRSGRAGCQRVFALYKLLVHVLCPDLSLGVVQKRQKVSAPTHAGQFGRGRLGLSTGGRKMFEGVNVPVHRQ